MGKDMLAVVIPTRNEADRLALTLAALVPAAAEGFVREVLIADAGSTDLTRRIAEDTGCVVVEAGERPGASLGRAAARSVRGEWLLFLQPGVILPPGWAHEAVAFVERAARTGRADDRAAVFRFAIDDVTAWARTRRTLVGLATGVTGLPHPAQPLLISKVFYRRIGGHQPLAALEDVDLVRRIGRRRLFTLRGEAALVPERRPPGLRSAETSRRILSRALASIGVPVRLLGRLHG